MGKLADYDHPAISELAARLTRSETTPRRKLDRIFHYVRDEIRFGFPMNGDFVKASETIQLGYGQCNTKATLLLALCKAAGIQARIHFSLITKDIQKGFFTGLAYWLMPNEISHSWIEVEIEGQWRRIDTFINDKSLFDAAKAKIKRLGWSVGYSVALEDGEASADLNLDHAAYQQMAAVTDDHGAWDDPSDYYESEKYRNRPDGVRMWFYRHLIGGINRRVEAVRSEPV
ncbi:Transglutaminase-like superfamily protein [Aliiroseovarius sediminilitoris]|uniref:Transglutaminase-like superfamily protein n=1 Tax=Aliiroseovarius sediminilitoris TaxID=1173584 RepID=A0A1I0R624_9RHOB|nr:transglutaminase family protein [Aliiroseovarius sediminilitoris]SEW35823.1 Transglutaminase-like superfamily protein [Aliiroseovarius sediminilitoris]